MQDEQTTTASVAVAPKPIFKKVKKRKYEMFDVSNETYNRFQQGRQKFERWSKYLNLNVKNEKAIYDFYNKTRGEHIIVLRNVDTGGLRSIRPAGV